MSYDKKGNHLAFFIPNIPLATTTSGVLREMDIGAASADHGELICVRSCRVVELMFTLVGELAGGTSVAPRVIFTKRPTPLSTTGEAVVGTVIVPDATAIGKTVYLPVDPVSFAVGDSMEISHVIGTGTPTGMGFYSYMCEEDPEVPGNNSDMILSA